MRATRLIAAITIAAGLTAGITACTAEDDGYARVCENPTTHQRVDDKQCDTAHPAFIWIYIATSRKAPAVGEKVTGGTRTMPKGATIEEAPVHGGVVEEPHVNAPVEHAPVEEPIHISVRG